jgi:hypothetical protein
MALMRLWPDVILVNRINLILGFVIFNTLNLLLVEIVPAYISSVAFIW